MNRPGDDMFMKECHIGSFSGFKTAAKLRQKPEFRKGAMPVLVKERGCCVRIMCGLSGAARYSVLHVWCLCEARWTTESVEGSSHQFGDLRGFWSGRRWDWRNGACGVRMGAWLRPLERADGS